MEWFLIVEPDGRRGSANMAVDHSLLRAAQEGVALLRLYRWSPPCLSFGRNEPARARYDPHTIRRLGLDTVRRPTGGRAVWHDAELTYAVAAPCPVFGSLAATYIEIHRVLAAALRQLGAPVELAARPTGRALTPGAGACFAAPAGGELVAGGAKLTGSAQVREGSAFLQHGSILLENGQHVVAQVSVRAGRPPAATSLGELLGRPIGFTEVAAAIADAAGRAWPGAWRHRDPPASADEGRYADPAWTWRR